MRNRIWGAVLVIVLGAILFGGLASTAEARNRGNRQLVCHLTDSGRYIWLWLKPNAAEAHLTNHEEDEPGKPRRLDIDRDGWGRDWILNHTCPAPWLAEVEYGDDCNDNPRKGGFDVNPGMEEIHDNNIDDDCNPDTPDSPPGPTEPPEGYCDLNGPCEAQGGLCDQEGSMALVWESADACFLSKRPGMSDDDSCRCR